MTFHTTRWSLVRRAAGDEASARDALDELCRTYWPPAYAYFRRATGDRDRAEDLTQGLFTRLLDGGSFSQADPERGRFRTWLLACARHHMANAAAKENAARRGGGEPLLSLDAAREEGRLSAEPTARDDGPEQAFARRWVAALVERTLDALAEEWQRRGRGRVFFAARPFLDPAVDPGPMRAAAAAIGTSEGAFKVAVHRLRTRLHEQLRAEIASTLEDPAEVDDELDHLQALLAAR